MGIKNFQEVETEINNIKKKLIRQKFEGGSLGEMEDQIKKIFNQLQNLNERLRVLESK